MSTPAIGSAAPEFSACNPDGLGAVTDAAFEGKTTVLSFFPAAFSGSPEQGCEMQLCAVNSLVAAAADKNVQFFGVSGDLPFANGAFAKKIDLAFPLLSDPTLASCARYVGVCPFGQFLKEAGVSDALEGARSTNRGVVVLDADKKVVYAFSGEGHPGKMPSLAEIKAAIGL